MYTFNYTIVQERSLPMYMYIHTCIYVYYTIFMHVRTYIYITLVIHSQVLFQYQVQTLDFPLLTWVAQSTLWSAAEVVATVQWIWLGCAPDPLVLLSSVKVCIDMYVRTYTYVCTCIIMLLKVVKIHLHYLYQTFSTQPFESKHQLQVLHFGKNLAPP